MFAKYGFDGVSTRLICEKAVCNISAISYHFGSKEELYHACLSDQGSNFLQLTESILLTPENEADFKVRLKCFMSQFFDHSIKNRELILMISKDANSKFAMESLHKIFQVIPEKLTFFFQKSIEQGLIRSDVDPSILCDQIINAYFVQTLFAETNQTFKKTSALDSSYRARFIEQQLKTIIDGVKVK